MESTQFRQKPACLALGLLALSVTPMAVRAQVPDAQAAAWTAARVREWRPKAGERRFDEIGWAKDIRTARRLAQRAHRPVFIFTMDGRINLGRC